MICTQWPATVATTRQNKRKTLIYASMLMCALSLCLRVICDEIMCRAYSVSRSRRRMTDGRRFERNRSAAAFAIPIFPRRYFEPSDNAVRDPQRQFFRYIFPRSSGDRAWCPSRGRWTLGRGGSRTRRCGTWAWSWWSAGVWSRGPCGWDVGSRAGADTRYCTAAATPRRRHRGRRRARAATAWISTAWQVAGPVSCWSAARASLHQPFVWHMFREYIILLLYMFQRKCWLFKKW